MCQRTFLKYWPLVLGLALVLTAGVLGPAASATAAGGIRATAPLQEGNWTNGEDYPSAPVIGKATFVRNGDEVKVTLSVKGLTPNTEMNLFLVAQNVDDVWYSIGYEQPFTTNARGSARVVHTWNLTTDVTEPGLSFDDYFAVSASGVTVADVGGSTPKVLLPSG